MLDSRSDLQTVFNFTLVNVPTVMAPAVPRSGDAIFANVERVVIFLYRKLIIVVMFVLDLCLGFGFYQMIC